MLGLDRVRDVDASANGVVTRTGTFIQDAQINTNKSSETFTAKAQIAGDLVMLHVQCRTPAPPTTVVVTGGSWTFDPLGVIVKSTSLYCASFVATAPDTAPSMFTVAWDSPCQTTVALGDEFQHAALDLHAERGAHGACNTTVGTTEANDAVWAACTIGMSTNAIGLGFDPGADDGNGDISEFRYTQDPAGMSEDVAFTTNDDYVVTAATLKPAP